MIDTWTCHICGASQPDDKIDVLSYPMRGLAGATCNVRYCKLNASCLFEALKWKKKGTFPIRKK